MFVVMKVVVENKSVCLSLPLDFGPEEDVVIAGGVRVACYTNFRVLFWCAVFGPGPMGLVFVVRLVRSFACSRMFPVIVCLFVTVCVVCLYVLVLHACICLLCMAFLHFFKL